MTNDSDPAEPTHDRPAQKVARAFGILLILAGLGMLAYIAWQYFGTNIVSKQKQEEVKQQIAEDWGKGLDSDAIGLLRVPRFGDTYEKPIVKGFGDDDLARGVGWDTKSAKPGADRQLRDRRPPSDARRGVLEVPQAQEGRSRVRRDAHRHLHLQAAQRRQEHHGRLHGGLAAAARACIPTRQVSGRPRPSSRCSPARSCSTPATATWSSAT